jgi:copper chaperone CopZ
MSVETITLKVAGEQTIHCNGCANTIQLALKRLPGVLKVAADPQTQHIGVTLKTGETGAAAITDTLEQLGYETVPDDNVA